MRTQALAVGLLAMLSAAPASADVLLNTLHSAATPNSTRITVPGAVTRGGPLALEFSVPTTTSIDKVMLQLNANTPGDGGSVLVYIVPNNSTPSLPNIAGGHPNFTGDNSSLSLTDADAGHLIGTILDSSLSTAVGGATVTLNTGVPVTPGEYWLALVNTATDTAKWVFDSTAFGGSTGTTGQSTFWQAGPTGGACAGHACTFLDSSNTANLYEAAILTPEPTTLAILGVGLAGMGFITRRRRSR